MIYAGERVKSGVVSAYRDVDSGLTVFSFVPDRVLNQGLIPIFLVFAGIYLVVIAVCSCSEYLFFTEIYKADSDDKRRYDRV